MSSPTTRRPATYVAGKASTTPHDLTEGVFAAPRPGRRIASRRSASPSTARRRASTPSCSDAASRSSCWPPTAPATSITSPAATAPRLYDIHYRKPTPLVPRSDIVEIGGRLNYAGEELEPLDEDAIRAAAQRVQATKGSARSPSPSSSATSTQRTSCAPARSCAEELGEDLQSRSPTRSRASGASTSAPPRPSSTPTSRPVVRRYLERLEAEMRERGLGVPAPRHAVERRHRDRRSRRAISRCRRSSPARSAARWAASPWPACSTART